MSVQNILAFIEKANQEVDERLNSRREAMQRFVSFSKKAALASLPFALVSVTNKVFAQTPPSATVVENVLQFALKLEYLESEFYTLALAKPALIVPGAAFTAITTIRDHQNLHVSFLMTTMADLDIKPDSKPNFDFTGGKGTGQGAFPTVFSDFDTFLALAQTFEDTGVRAYKGLATELRGGKTVLTDILRIHSVEARHASHVRQMRKARGANVKPWITGKDSGIGPAVQSSYDGEDADEQNDIRITEINKFPITAAAATECFDEPLTQAEVLEIIDPFIVV